MVKLRFWVTESRFLGDGDLLNSDSIFERLMPDGKWRYNLQKAWSLNRASKWLAEHGYKAEWWSLADTIRLNGHKALQLEVRFELEKEAVG